MFRIAEGASELGHDLFARREIVDRRRGSRVHDRSFEVVQDRSRRERTLTERGCDTGVSARDHVTHGEDPGPGGAQVPIDDHRSRPIEVELPVEQLRVRCARDLHDQPLDSYLLPLPARRSHEDDLLEPLRAVRGFELPAGKFFDPWLVTKLRDGCPDVR